MNNSARRRKLGRRSLLQGLGTAALLAPFADPRRVMAADTERFDNLLVVTFPDGLAGNWTPASEGGPLLLSEMLAPLEPYRDELLIVTGLEGGSTNPILAHNQGTVSLWTGSTNYPEAHSYATHPSIDQVIAERMGGTTPYKSLHAGVQTNLFSFLNGPYVHFSGSEQPVPAEDDPNALYKLIAGNIAGPDVSDTDLERIRREQRSVLDYVLGDLKALESRVSVADRPKLEEHAARIRAIEKTLDGGGVSAACTSPDQPTLTAEAARENENFEVTARLQMDLLATALQCGLTKVATLQYSNTDCQLRLARLNTSRSVHEAAHDQGSTDAEREEWSRFFVETVSYVLERLASTPMEGGLTLLDKTLVVIGSEMGNPGHGNAPMPFFIAGGQGGYFKKNAHVQVPGGFFDQQRHTKLLTNIVQAFGIEAESFGEFTDERSNGWLEAVRA